MLKRTPLKRGSKRLQSKPPEKVDRSEEKAFYEEIWSERPHVCESCGTYLYGDLMMINIEHLLEKNYYSEFRMVKENIALVCGDCQVLKTNGFPTKRHRELIDNAYKTLVGD